MSRAIMNEQITREQHAVEDEAERKGVDLSGPPVDDDDPFALPTLTVQDAIAAHLKRIEAAELEAARIQAQKEALAEAARQRWIAAMRERIELEYGLVLTDEDVAAWTVEKMGGDSFEMDWLLSAEKGNKVWPNQTLNFDNVTPPGIDWLWNAWNCDAGQCLGFETLIAALTYAQTSKRLWPMTACTRPEAATQQAEVMEDFLEFVSELVGKTDLIDGLLQWSFQQRTG